MKRFAAVFLALAILAGTAFAQAAPRVLTQADIDRFIRDFPAMTRDMEAAGTDFDEDVASSQDDPASFSPAALKSILNQAKAAAEIAASWTIRLEPIGSGTSTIRPCGRVRSHDGS
jgi:hypothetical protein